MAIQQPTEVEERKIDMAYKLKVNNKNVYNIKDGFSIKEEFNETLDSATVQFNVYGQEIDDVSFDDVEIYDTDNKISKKKLLVDSYDDEIFSFGDDYTEDDHTYTMSFFSETKDLERITLPNCSVTQPLTGTKKTVLEEIKRFCDIYVPKIKVYDASATLGYKYVDSLKLSTEQLARFNSIECPEFQWNEPTLKEVLNDLMSTADCIVVVKNKEIGCYDITKKENPIDVTKLSYSKRTMSSADYCGELTINMQNAIGKNVTTVCEKKGLRTTEGELTTSNAIFITQKPIYNIKSCKISYFIGSATPVAAMRYYKDLDITDYIVEKDVYDVASSARYNPPTGLDETIAKDYKHYLLYYTRGTNQIRGWGETMKPDTVSSAVSHIGWICYLLDKETFPRNVGLPTDGFAWKDINARKDIRGIHVDLVYETISGHSMHVGKYLSVRHPDNRIFDNQQNSYVDANNQSIFEYAKVNRLGNKIRTIQGEYYNEGDIPKLGDYIGDEILFSKEVIYYDDILFFKGMLTPNYILKDYFTGVRARKRSWQLAKEDEALERNDVFKYYVEFSFNQKSDKISDFNLPINNSNDFSVGKLVNIGSDLQGSEAKYCVIKTQVSLSPGVMRDLPSSPNSYQIDVDKEILGMSLDFTFKTLDNVQVDYYVKQQDTSLVNNIYKYCDSNGEFEYIIVAIASRIDSSDGEMSFPSNGQYWDVTSQEAIDNCNASMQDVMNIISKKPEVKTDNINARFGSDNITTCFALRRKIKKDNREILQNHIQFEYCSDTKDIIVTQNMIRNCSFYGNYITDFFKVYTSTSETYDVNDTNAKGDYVGYVIAYIRLTVIDRLSCKITLRNVDMTNIKSWCIADNNDKILLAVNGKKTDVHVNLLKSRDTNIYYSQQNRTIVGDITNDSLGQLDSNVAAYEAALNEEE